MKLKMTYDEAHVLMHELKTFTWWNSVTRYEKDVTSAILKVLLIKIMKRLLDAKPKLMKPKKPIYISFDLTHETVLALDFVTKNMLPEHEYNQVVIWEIQSKLNQHLVNIS